MYEFNGKDREYLIELSKTRQAGQGFYYILEVQDYVKIGMTANICSRYGALRAMLTHYGNREVGRMLISKPHCKFAANEKALHNRFAKYRINKTELFALRYAEIKALLVDEGLIHIEKKIIEESDVGAQWVEEFAKKCVEQREESEREEYTNAECVALILQELHIPVVEVARTISVSDLKKLIIKYSAEGAR